MRVNSTDSPAQSSAAPRSTALSVDLRRLPTTRPLFADYVHRFDALQPFYAGDPANADAWMDAIHRVHAHKRDSAGMAAVIAAQQQRRGAPAEAVDAARLLADPQTVAVVTGQQAGLFGGPLYTLLKAITAMKLARRVSEERGVRAVPVFWVDAEDHDWDEVRSCTVFDAGAAPQTVSLPAKADKENTPVGAVRLDDSVTAAIEQLEQVLPATEFRAELVVGLRRCYQPGRTMAEAFASWLEAALGSRGLVVYESSDRSAKPFARPVFTREIEACRTTLLANEAGAELTQRGYHAQVQAQPDSVALFHLNAERRPIRKRDGAFLIGDADIDSRALAEEASQQPERFSPNVLLRPVVEDLLFPTIAYVAGPSELAYFGQLRSVYEHFGVPMPIVYPRATATLADSATLRFLTKYNVSLEAMQPQDEAALNQLLQAQIPTVIEETFGETSQAIERHMTRLAEVLPALDPTLEGTARSTLGKMQHDLQTLHGKTIQAAKRRDETLRRQYMRVRALTFPEGHPQERAIGFVSFLNQYGTALVDRLFDELPLDLGQHWVIPI